MANALVSLLGSQHWRGNVLDDGLRKHRHLPTTTTPLTITASPQHSQLLRLSPTIVTFRHLSLSMNGVHASSSPAPSPLSTFTGNLIASLPPTYLELFPELPNTPAYTEPPSESSNISAYRQQLDSFSSSDMLFSEESSELVHNDGTELRGDLRQFPPELRNMIMAYVLGTYENEDGHPDLFGRPSPSPSRSRSRKWLSRLSLVCHSWCRTLRPRLFERLSLRSQSDVYFLDSMLRQPQSGWLSAAVKRLYLDVGLDSRMDLERVLLVLSKKLPSLQELYHRPALDIQETESLGSCLLRSLPRYSSLHTIELRGITVYSFALLVKLVGSIPRLEDLLCDDVNWIHQEDVERPPTQMAPFLHLSRIGVYNGCPAPRRYLWLFCTIILRRCTPSSTTIESHDFMLMTIIAKAARHMDNEKSYCWLDLVYDSGQNKLSVSPLGENRIEIFKFWSIAPATLNDISSVLRSVEISLRWDTYSYGDGAEWVAVDTAFAQKATSIEAFSVDIGVSDSDEHITIGILLRHVRSCFPRLIERGIVRMRIKDGDEIHYDWHPVHPAHDSGAESTSDDSENPSDSSGPNI